MFPKATKQSVCSIEKCSRRYDICKYFVEVSTEFTSHATKRIYKIRGTLTCKTINTINFIACKCCSKQYTVFATGF